jgi:hypothetical protein
MAKLRILVLCFPYFSVIDNSIHKLFLSLNNFFDNRALSLSPLQNWSIHIIMFKIWFTQPPCNIDDGVKMKHFFGCSLVV